MTSLAPTRLDDPYVGPVSFRLGDPLYGRDREREDILDLLIAERIVLLYSPSGAGKSSLIEAALVPALREAGFEVLPTIRVTHTLPPEPGMHAPPNRYVMSVLLSLEEGVPADRQHPVAELATLTLREYLKAHADRDGRPGNEVLVFDQFEEVLTADPTDEPAKHAFFRQLGEVLRDRGHWALISMREDFLAALDPYLRYLPTRLKTTYRLDLLSVPEALEAIRRPAERAGVNFTEDAARQLVDDLRIVRVQGVNGITQVLGSYVEPVQLQVACHLLWSMLPPEATEITRADVDALGRVDQALAGYYAERVEAAAARTGVPERVIRDWFDERLITPQGLRSQVLEGPESSTGAAHRLLSELLDAHLVRAETRRQATWYELAHDRLIEPVRRDNAAWRVHHLSSVERAAMLWEQEGRPDRLLLVGSDLASAEQDAAAHGESATARQREFLDASRRIDEQQRRDAENAAALKRSARRLRITAILMAVLAVASLVLLWQSVTATLNSARQEASTRLLLGAQENLESDESLTAALALEVADRLDAGDLEIARGVLYQAAQSPVSEVLRGQTGPVESAAFSADGSTVVTAGSEDLQLWDRRTGDRGEALALEDDDVVSSVDINNDGSMVVAGLEDGELILWRVGTDEPERWSDETGAVWSVDISPDGEHLASVGLNNEVQVWGVDTELQHTLVAPGSTLAWHAVFSPDGRLLATGSDLSEVLIWNVVSGRQTGRVALPDGEHPYGVWFGEDAQTIATYTESAVTVWDVSTNEEVYPPFVVSSDSYNMSEDLSEVLAVDSWGRLSVFDMASGEQTAQSYVVGATLCCAGFDLDPGRALVLAEDAAPSFWRLEPYSSAIATSAVVAGGSVFTVWDDGTLRRWDAEDGSLGADVVAGVDAFDVAELAADASGDRLLGLTYDGEVRMWDMSSGTELEGPVADTAFAAAALTPDGRKVIVADADGGATVWDVDTGTYGSRLYEPGDRAVARIDVSGDGSTALLALDSPADPTPGAAADGDIPAAVIVPVGGSDDAIELLLPAGVVVTTAAFSADGAHVTLGTSTGSIATFATASGKPRGKLAAHQGQVGDVAVGDDARGLMLTTAAAGNQVVLVDREHGAFRTVPSRDDLIAATLSAEGRDILLFTVDGAVRTVPIDDAELVDLVRSQVGYELTSEDCQQLGVDDC